MTVSLPLVFVLGFFVWGAIKFLGVRPWIVILIALFGFWLSHTFFAPRHRIRHAYWRVRCKRLTCLDE